MYDAGYKLVDHHEISIMPLSYKSQTLMISPQRVLG